MALTGLFLCLFLIAHLAGNLQLLDMSPEGQLKFNAYAKFMTTFPPVKVVSYLLYASILFHAFDGFLLTIQNRKARPVKYSYEKPSANSAWYSRQMALLGTLILVFLVILLFAFKMDLFRFNLYGGDLTTGLFEQVKATMLVTVFVFIGIEGASVYSRYAKERKDVGWATIAGFIGVTGLMVLVTLLPYAVLQRADIAGMRQPSMAGVLEAVVGPWGAVFVSVGLLVSVLGAYLAWALICAEVMFAAGKSKDMPKAFAKTNANGVPVTAMWWTSIIIQIIVITTYWSRDAFSLMLNLTSATTLIPYFLVAAYGFMIAKRGETYQVRPEERQRDLVLGGIAVAYTLFMLYAGGLKYILLAAILFAPGTVMYFIARREQGKPVFDRTSDWVIFGIIVAAAVYGVYGLATGAISI